MPRWQHRRLGRARSGAFGAYGTVVPVPLKDLPGWLPVAAYPLPHSSRPSVLMPGVIGPGTATRAYRAVRPGQAVLLDRTDGCLILHGRRSREAHGTCPVAVVTVVP